MNMNKIDKIIKILRKETRKYIKPAMDQIKDTNYSPYKILISCLLSLRTKDSVTIEASKRLFSLADTPEKMVKIDLKEIEDAIKPSNYYKTKAKRIKEISKTLIEKYNGKVPDQFDELIKLKGVGRKTANIVLTHAFGKNAIAVDTHVHRISNRLGLVKTKTPHQTEEELKKILPKKYWKIYNDLLVVWGQNICKPVKPLCEKCAIYKYCERVGVLK
ncbi:MAG: endonuclease III [Candidatus Aenigmarchaeota archaeon]|nr:endonuclease III [Candidatus Aenigmarchaeota archaeon]MBU5689284.1 endonuclease III [Candidatus Aenigmarchaeota archaeon]